MSESNQSQLAALLALLGANQPNKGSVAANSPVSSLPPPSASGSLDLSNLIPSTPAAAFQPAPSRYGDAFVDRNHSKDDDYYRQHERNHDRVSMSRSSGFEEHRLERDTPRDWERDREHDRREPKRQGRYRDRSISPGVGRSYSPGHTDYEDQLPIDTIHVGMVIGRGGETLRRIERESGARVQFAPESQSRPGVRIANLSGSVSQVNAARNAIKALIEKSSVGKVGGGHRESQSQPGGRSRDRGKDGQSTTTANKLTFSVPDKCVGLIIGRLGESINEIQKVSGARVNIVPESQSVNGRRPVNLFGTDEANQRARELIEAIVLQDELGLKKGQQTRTDASQRPTEQSTQSSRGIQSASGSTAADSLSLDTHPLPSHYATYQNPFQYVQSHNADSSGLGTQPSSTQAWAAYYAQQAQQNSQTPAPNYPRYTND